MQPPKVFISYRRDASNWLAAFLHHLLINEHQRDVFLDIQSLEIGNWSSLIAEAIKQAHFFLLILSPRTFEDFDPTGALAAEIRIAIENRRHIFCVTHDDFSWSPPTQLPDEFRKHLASRNSLGLHFKHDDIYHCARTINDWTSEYLETVPIVEVNQELARSVIESLEDEDYKEELNRYFEPDYCDVCDPSEEKKWAAYINWSNGIRILKGEDLVEKTGSCEYCSSPQIQCSKCGEITGFANAGALDCEGGCGNKFEIIQTRDFDYELVASEVEE